MRSNTTAFILIISLLSACGGQATNVRILLPTEDTVLPTETLTIFPTSTNTVVPKDTVQPTEIPATQPVEEISSGAAVSFTNDVFPIIQSRCINCHGGNRTEEGLVMLTYAELMAGSNNGPVVMPRDSANSLLVEMVSTQKMPKRGPKLTPLQVQVIIDWINQGALDN
jgi:uncharacterized membrane protein